MTAEEHLKTLRHPFGPKSELLRRFIIEAMESYSVHCIIKDRERIFKQIAEQVWDCHTDCEHDYAIGYDDNGIPDSVSLEIHGRTHSDLSFPYKPINHDKQTN